MLREVDVVISALAFPQVLDQLKIIEAIKVAGNIKVHIPLVYIMFNLNSMCGTMLVMSCLIVYRGFCHQISGLKRTG